MKLWTPDLSLVGVISGSVSSVNYCVCVCACVRVCRSQQDSAGERARRQREVEQTEGELRQLKDELGAILAKKHGVEETMKHIDDRMRQLE